MPPDLQSWRPAVSHWGVAGVAATVGALAGGAIAAGTSQALALGGSLNELSEQTGIAAGAVLVLQQAFKNSGVDAEKLRPTINRLQKAIAAAETGNNTARESFAALGVDWQGIAKLSPDRQFAKVSAAIAAIAAPAKRTAAAMAIFGKSGGELLALFRDPQALAQAQREIGKAAEILNAKAPIFDDIGDKIRNMIPAKLSGFFVGFTDSVSGPLLGLLKRLEGLDLAGVGEAFGKAVLKYAQFYVDSFYTVRRLIMDGRVGFAQMALLAAQTVNSLWRGLARIGAFVDGILQGAVYMSKTLIAGVAENIASIALDLQSSLQYVFQVCARSFGDVMGPVIDAISAGLEFAIQNVMATLAKIPILNEKLGLKGFQADTFESIQGNRTADRQARQSQQFKGYAEIRADNYKNSGWLQAVNNFAKATEASGLQNKAKSAEAFAVSMQPNITGDIINTEPFAVNLEQQRAARSAVAAQPRFSIPSLSAPVAPAAPAALQSVSQFARLQQYKFGEATRMSLGESPSLRSYSDLGLPPGSRPGSFKLTSGGFGGPESAGTGLLGGGIGMSAEAQKNQAAKSKSKDEEKENTVEGTNELLGDIYGVMAKAWG